MSSSELKIRTTKLLNQISEIKNGRVTSDHFNSFLNHLKTEATSLLAHADNREIQNQLNELANLKSFDELSGIKRFLVKLVVSKNHINWLNNWTSEGKYLYDLHNIELKLGGIQYKLHNN